jgi:hypothetical protein
MLSSPGIEAEGIHETEVADRAICMVDPVSRIAACAFVTAGAFSGVFHGE